MRSNTILLLAAWATLEACDERINPPPADGTLVISTITDGADPDPDGFQLTIDGVKSIALRPIDSADVVVSAGRHTLGLLDVSGQCSVDPGIPHDVEIPLEGAIPVIFAVNCPAVGAGITVRTTGTDIDRDGYRVTVDDIDQAPIPSNAVAFIRAEPGSRRIALTGLAPNCAVADSSSQTVSILANQVTPVVFDVMCTATSGAIVVSITASGRDVEGEYGVIADGLPLLRFQFGPGTDGVLVPAGDHHLYLVAPLNCTVKTPPQLVTVNSGGLVRDTVEVSFSVTCVKNEGTLRITAPTTGPLPNVRYHIGLCDDWYCYYGATFLGDIAPNGMLVVQVRGSTSGILEVSNVPPNCVARDPSIQITVALGDTLDVAFPVTCTP